MPGGCLPSASLLIVPNRKCPLYMGPRPARDAHSVTFACWSVSAFRTSVCPLFRARFQRGGAVLSKTGSAWNFKFRVLPTAKTYILNSFSGWVPHGIPLFMYYPEVPTF